MKLPRHQKLVNQFGTIQQPDNAMVIPLHGGEIPPDSDGFAELWFGNKNTSADPTYPLAISPALSYFAARDLLGVIGFWVFGFEPKGRTFDEIERSFQEVRADGDRELHISCVGTLAMKWLIPRLSGFHARHPEWTSTVAATTVCAPTTRHPRCRAPGHVAVFVEPDRKTPRSSHGAQTADAHHAAGRTDRGRGPPRRDAASRLRWNRRGTQRANRTNFTTSPLPAHRRLPLSPRRSLELVATNSHLTDTSSN